VRRDLHAGRSATMTATVGEQLRRHRRPAQVCGVRTSATGDATPARAQACGRRPRRLRSAFRPSGHLHEPSLTHDVRERDFRHSFLGSASRPEHVVVLP
jgi:hypothetical protein